MANKGKLDVEKVIYEYYMLKSVLNNQYAKDIVSGKIEPVGPSAAADKKTLQAMQRYVRILDELVVSDNGLTGKETLGDFLARLDGNMRQEDAQKPESKRANYSQNPFDENYRYVVKDVLARENAKSVIEKSISSNKMALDSVNSLVINLGGKKQGSYVKLLAQSTDLFSSVSGLQDKIATLEATKGSNDAELLRLRGLLSERKNQAKAYKALCNKMIDSFGSDSSVLGTMLRQTEQSLDSVVKGEAEKTRVHITNEANRVIENMNAKDKIKAVLLSNTGKNSRYVAVLSGKQLNDKGMRNLYEEVKNAAKVAGFSEKDPVVDQFYNDLSEENIKNTAKMNNVPVGQTKKKKGIKGIVAIGLAFSLFAGGLVTGSLIHARGNGNGTTSTPTSTFQNEYNEYSLNENRELSEFEIQLDNAIKNNQIGVFEITPSQKALDSAIEEFAKTDNIEKFNWSSTESMKQLKENAEISAKADYYQNHYEDLLEKASGLEGQVANLTAQLDNANKSIGNLEAQLNSSKTEIESLKTTVSSLQNKITELEGQIENLKSQIENLQSILDAANDNNSELQAKIDNMKEKLEAAEETISGLQNQLDQTISENETLKNDNESLKQENAELKEKLAEANAKIDSLENTIDGLNSQIESLKGENSTLSSEKADLILKVSQLESEINELKDQIAKLDNGGLIAENNQLKEKVSDLEEKLAKANAEISSLQSENESLTNQIVDLNKSIENLNGSINKLEEELANEKATNASLNERIKELEGDLEKAISDYNELKSAYDELLNKGPVSQEQYESLVKELEDAYNTITGYESQIVRLYNGLTREQTTNSQAGQNLENLMKMFGIDYKEVDAPSNDNSEYQP